MEVNIHRAKTNLSQLILKAESGEDVVIARAGKPVVRLVPVKTAERKMERKLYKPGSFKGRIKVSDDFLEPDPALDREMEDLFYHAPLVHLETPKRKTKAAKTGARRQR